MIKELSFAECDDVGGGVTLEEAVQAAREAGYAVGNAIEAAWDWLTK